MGYTLEAVEKMRAQLRELPPIERQKRELNKQEAVETLTTEIVSLQKRGYGLEQISESLKGIGLDISTGTLRSYLQRVKGKRKKTPKATSSVAPKAPQGNPPQDSEKHPAKDSGAAKSWKLDTTDEFMGEDRKKL